ncbi:bifunctional diguanylate cyclase/phosphodiesterase [Algibacillus agarilyticus]|uniref:bifunctional diguanylate cyclase/phosphodiesterase n=1 Tax=Algibacillus agarilyticus TaxID=2234133 RepID=UPI000DD02516|nr:EAL domain-containing protein [Algibacillus agarilyticus]
MTLFRQLLMVIVLSFMANLIGVLWLQFESTRDYLTNQLESDLNNTSTSLSMALTPYLTDGDAVLVESTINAYFDGGYYEEIKVEILTTEQTITKKIPVKINGVPSWFVDLISIEVPSIETTITDGWLQAGVLSIKGHPGFAYKQLWDAFLAMSSWIGSLSLVLIMFASVGLNLILKPLESIRRKAQEIQERKFGEPLKLPKTRELSAVTHAINQMTAKLKEQFEEEARLHNKLKEQAFQDATTGFGNRAFFNRQLQAWLSDDHSGGVVFIELLGIDEINKKDGWNKRDDVIKSAANFIDTTFNDESGAVKCRLSAHEFALILDGSDESQIVTQLTGLAANLQAASYRENFYQERIFNIGAVHITAEANNGEVLSLADNAMQQARTENSGIFVLEQTDQQQDKMAKLDIKQAIETAIESSALGFTRQPVYSFEKNKKPVHFEAYAKLNLEDMGSVNAGMFISVLDEFDLGDRFDKKVIELVIQHLKSGSEQVYAVNLTASALKSDEFIAWMINALRSIPAYANQICFEFTEESVIYNREKIEFMCAQFAALGVQFGVDRVGRNFSSLSYLQSLHPNYVKIDHAYTQMALSSDNDAYFVGSLCTTIHNLDVDVIATRVENEEQLNILKEYHFDAYQGFIYKPEPFEIGKRS